MYISTNIPVLGLPEPPRLCHMSSSSAIPRACPRRPPFGTWSPGRNRTHKQEDYLVASRNYVDAEGFYTEHLADNVILRHSVRALPERLIIERLRPHHCRSDLIQEDPAKPDDAVLHGGVHELGGRPIYARVQRVSSETRRKVPAILQSNVQGKCLPLVHLTVPCFLFSLMLFASSTYLQTACESIMPSESH